MNTHAHTQRGGEQIENSEDISGSHPVALPSGVHAHDHDKGEAGCLSHRAEELRF